MGLACKHELTVDASARDVLSHKTVLVDVFLAKHTNVRIHYTTTYSSCLNQVENWFSRIQRDVISHGIFTSVRDLDRKLVRYIRQYNKDPRPQVETVGAPALPCRTTRASLHRALSVA